MNKIITKLFVFGCLLFSTTTTAFSQLTIGSNDAPIAGAILQLKDDGADYSNNETASKGLGLPRVMLQAYNKLQMGTTAPDLTATGAADHVGLVVYNVNTSFDQCDATSIPSGLHVWDGFKWEGISVQSHFVPTPPDLSKRPYIYLKQPNTYMVTTVGSANSVSIPIAKAFAVWNYWASAAGGNKVKPRTFSGTLSASVVWQEGMGQTNDANDPILSATTPVTLSSTAIADSLSATITVNTTGALGNALVSLSDANGILWSWHIWVTASPATIDYNGNYWMDRNLGATSATVAANGSIGLQYQWGRNNPLPGYRTFTTPSTITTTIPIATAISDASNNGGANSLAYVIKKPTSFITNSGGSYDWYSTTSADWDTRWADQTLDVCKNAYDMPTITNPCPAGWKVPVAIGTTGTSADSPWSTLTAANGGTFDKGYNWTATAAPAGYYPAAGYRYSEGSLSSIANYGFFWSASPSSYVASTLHFSSGDVNPWLNLYRAYGFSVRCVQE